MTIGVIGNVITKTQYAEKRKTKCRHTLGQCSQNSFLQR